VVSTLPSAEAVSVRVHRLRPHLRDGLEGWRRWRRPSRACRRGLRHWAIRPSRRRRPPRRPPGDRPAAPRRLRASPSPSRPAAAAPAPGAEPAPPPRAGPRCRARARARRRPAQRRGDRAGRGLAALGSPMTVRVDIRKLDRLMNIRGRAGAGQDQPAAGERVGAQRAGGMVELAAQLQRRDAHPGAQARRAPEWASSKCGLGPARAGLRQAGADGAQGGAGGGQGSTCASPAASSSSTSSSSRTCPTR
jgi:chemotaxis protein histidine kinase CheA